MFEIAADGVSMKRICAEIAFLFHLPHGSVFPARPSAAMQPACPEPGWI
jgi:hypothetical protein